MTTVTRIKVPTAQDWATGPNALRHPTATDADSLLKSELDVSLSPLLADKGES